MGQEDRMSTVRLQDEALVREGLWARYEAAGPAGDKEVAYWLGVAHFEPGQRTAQDAFPSGRPINIMHLSAFSAGWAKAKGATK
jgi:hypothetical protein